MRNFKAALFDLDGTLFNTEDQYTIFWGQTARKYRPDIPRLEYLIKGTTLKQIFERYFPNPEMQAAIKAELDAYERQMRYEWLPGSLDFLQDLKQRGVKCAVVTSSNLEKMRSVALQWPEFNQLFDRVLTSEDFTASKPAPDCYLLAARLFDCPTSECVVFEDAFTGLEAGMSAGIYTIGITTGNTREQIQDKCNHVIDSFVGLSHDEVLQWLNQD